MALPFWAHNVLQILFLAVGVAFVLRLKLPAAACWTLSGLALTGLLLLPPPPAQPGGDLGYFWAAGRLLWEGKNPYEHPAILHPPTALPLFALLGLLPWTACAQLWRVLSLAGHVALIPFAQKVLADPEAPAEDSWRHPVPELALLCAAFVYSVAVRYSLAEAQLSFLPTLAIFAALWARKRERALPAGVALAVSSIKFTTLIPFLLLFLRKQDRRTWIVMVLAGFALTFAATRPSELIPRLGSELKNIRHAGEPGEINDFSFSNARNEDLFSFEYAFYHLGLRSRPLAGAAQLAASVGLLAFLGWQCFRRPRIGWAGACSLIACGSGLFLYHRLYDMVVLALPLVYAAGRGRQERGAAGWMYRGAALAMLVALYLRAAHLVRLAERARDGGVVGAFLEAAILPYGIWMTLAALLLISAAERRRVAAAAVAAPKAL